MDCLEHPDISFVMRTGLLPGQAENQDTPEARADFAKEYFRDFLDFALDGDPDLLENFCEHYRWRYKDFLN